jgi:hypothetical protein
MAVFFGVSHGVSLMRSEITAAELLGGPRFAYSASRPGKLCAMNEVDQMIYRRDKVYRCTSEAVKACLALATDVQERPSDGPASE